MRSVPRGISRVTNTPRRRGDSNATPALLQPGLERDPPIPPSRRIKSGWTYPPCFWTQWQRLFHTPAFSFCSRSCDWWSGAAGGSRWPHDEVGSASLIMLGTGERTNGFGSSAIRRCRATDSLAFLGGSHAGATPTSWMVCWLASGGSKKEHGRSSEVGHHGGWVVWSQFTSVSLTVNLFNETYKYNSFWKMLLWLNVKTTS